MSGDAYDVIVVGAGAAGLLAAARAAEEGCRTLLLEKNRRPGVKILMSGGTRCNLTQSTDRRGIVKAYGAQGPFLHSALAVLGPRELVELIEAEGVPTKVEPTGKIFPVSDRAVDVLDGLMRRFHRSGAELGLEEPLVDLSRDGDAFMLHTPKRELRAARVIVTTGGLSYPGSGTTGDGLRWARQMGHTLVPTHPALVPITVAETWVPGLKGITLPDVRVQIVEPTPARRALAEARGSLLFTHFGLSGPVVLDVSRAVSSHAAPSSLQVECDVWPDIREADVDARLRELSALGAKPIVGEFTPTLPKRFVETLFHLMEIPLERKGSEFSKAERQALARSLKHLALQATGTLGYAKAEVTAGGVSLDEIDSRTMQSKLVPGLYFAGEVLDLDGPIGGYNFQAAFATGALAGQSASTSLERDQHG